MSPQLPLQPTPFIGRETELQELFKLLDQTDIRLLSILGFGGVGKTRLALVAAQQQAENFGPQIYAVSLLPINSWDQAALAIADTILGEDV